MIEQDGFWFFHRHKFNDELFNVVPSQVQPKIAGVLRSEETDLYDIRAFHILVDAVFSAIERRFAQPIQFHFASPLRSLPLSISLSSDYLEAEREIMSDRSDAAHQKAFQHGQDAWRDNKDLERDNPYPPVSPDHDFWRQGWETENEIHHK